MGYRLGELNQRVTIEQSTNVRNNSGGASVTWSTRAQVWALVRPLRGDERKNLQRRESIGDYLIVTRNRSDVLARDRIDWRGRKLNIVFIRERGPRQQFLEIEAVLGGSS